MPLFTALLLSSCSFGAKKSYPHEGDVTAIPDAIPKFEPKSRYGNPASYKVAGKRYFVLDDARGYLEQGIASWYGPGFHGKRTSSGETYDMYAMTAAHKTLPLPTYVAVTNLINKKTVIVKVNDRGPFHGNRVIDLSYVAAMKLDILKSGTGLVEIKAIDSAQYTNKRKLNRASSARSDNPTFYIQVGAFIKLANAKDMRNKLQDVGGRQVKIKRGVFNGDRIYRVRIGPLDSISAADMIADRLAELNIFDHHIVVE